MAEVSSSGQSRTENSNNSEELEHLSADVLLDLPYIIEDDKLCVLFCVSSIHTSVIDTPLAQQTSMQK